MMRADFFGQFLGGTCIPLTTVTEDTQPGTGTPPNYSATLTLLPPAAMPKCYKLVVEVKTACFTTTLFRDYILAFSSCTPTPQWHEARPATWASDLDVEGGRLQVVVNGTAASYPGVGRSYGTAPFVSGENRVEATLVEGRGRPGLWRFDALASGGVVPASIRVIAGEVVTVGEGGVTFRLHGQAGERVTFVFQRR